MNEPKRGRPPLCPGDTPAKVQVYVPSRDYDRVLRIAKRDDVSVPEVIRRGIAKVISDTSSE